MMNSEIHRILLTVIIMIGVFTSCSRAGELVKMVERYDPAPGNTGDFLIFGQQFGMIPAISGRNIAFGANTEEAAGVYAIIDGTIIVIADTKTHFPGLDEHFGFGGANGVSPSIDGKNVAFAARTSLGGSIWTYIDGELRQIADRFTPVPEGIGTFRNFGTLNGSSPSISGENVAFIATWPREGNTTLGRGVYAHINGELRVIVDTNTLVPGETTTFGSFGVSDGLSSSISGENVVFGAAWKGNGNPGVFGIYAWINGSLRVIADTRTQVPGLETNFFNFNFLSGSSPSISGENIVFISVIPNGIYGYINGELRTIVDGNTQAPNGEGLFTNLGQLGGTQPSIDGENIAFVAQSPKGIFACINGELRTIADTNTMVPGRNAMFTNFKALEGTSPTISGENVLFGAIAFDEEMSGFNGLYAQMDTRMIPAVSTWRIIQLVLLILIAGTVILRRPMLPRHCC